MIEITSSRILDYVNEAETKIICHNKKRINLEDSFREKPIMGAIVLEVLYSS